MKYINVDKEIAAASQGVNSPKAKAQYSQAQEALQELGAALQRGESDAFDKLYLHFSKPLFDFLNTILHDPEEARNILQDTFLYILTHKQEFDFSQNIKGLLYTLSKRRAIDHFRQRKKDQQTQSEYYTGTTKLESSLETNYISDEIAEIIEITVSSMPQMRKKVFTMKQDGKSNRAIAKELGLHESTVSEHLKSARDDLRRMIRIMVFFNLV